jgi:hypothetical protein
MRSSTHTRLYINFNLHEQFLKSKETDTLKSHFEDFIYRTPTGNTSDTTDDENAAFYKSEQGGLSHPLTVDIKLSGIPPDRELDKENRHKDLIDIPVNKDSLLKDFRAPEHGELVRTPTGDQRGTIRMESSSGMNGLEAVEEESSTNRFSSPLSTSSRSTAKSIGKMARSPLPPATGNLASLGEISRAKVNLDQRSPLVKRNSQLFNLGSK